MSSDSDMAANAWPGFVDILSAVVIMFVFFVLIISAVLYFYTITYKARIEGQVASITQSNDSRSSSSSLDELKKQNEILQEQLALAAASPVELDGSEKTSGGSDTPTPSQSEAVQAYGLQVTEQQILAADDNSSMVVFHDPGAITIDEVSAEKIREFVAQAVERNGGSNVEIVINSPRIEDAMTQNRAKRLAVARMLNIRNALLDSELNRENIQLKVVEAETIGESENWTRLEVNELP